MLQQITEPLKKWLEYTIRIAMDYEKLIELIEQLRDENNCDVLDYIDDAATAIETLLAEREAAVAHAHCVTNWLGDCHCSNCGESIDATSSFCNRCGAKLDEPEQCED